jgi:hypothetical protein
MRKAMNITKYAVIGYTMAVGTAICLLTTNCFVLSMIERAIETRLNPLNIVDWIWIFVGS